MVSVDGSVPCICSVSGLMVQSEHSPSHDSISSLIPFDIQLVTVSLSVGEMSPLGKFSSDIAQKTMISCRVQASTTVTLRSLHSRHSEKQSGTVPDCLESLPADVHLVACHRSHLLPDSTGRVVTVELAAGIPAPVPDCSLLVTFLAPEDKQNGL
ncbi:hypothetical protein GDO86_019965 [Hymenochirus boettgeri]|uniref:Uncharacterized protein n=1 Tax=Hymenochirus boettgeri TaxID=247094 RepID=A0A8T2IJ67_9PIPI|nr:hypothetical protein GDO86_019965 [Hymenochirus boettgeri]KAG8430816.1 hypothetical protein GDO86_019965 [Hymenochirus boettgeri]KAG8430817.1 hypothetical protein GDO86_019965 [Hymenochirus boettgeri]KAG8430818.1 hypothetical protein GDO86_019965 [Hymenochirus boettgeri]